MGANKLEEIDSKTIDEDQYCSICKLELRRNQSILQCPFCKHLFHREHIEEWLETKTECPVCQKELREKTSSKQTKRGHQPSVESSSDDFIVETQRRFINPSINAKRKLTRNRIIFLVIGLIFLAFPTVIIANIHKNGYAPNGLPPTIGVSVFFIVGLVLVIIPFTYGYTFRYKWRTIEFNADCIFIQGDFKEKELKLEPQNIDAFVFSQTYGSDSIAENDPLINRTEYSILYKINMKKGHNYYFRNLTRSLVEQEHDDLYAQLRAMLQQLYPGIKLTYEKLWG